MTFYVYQYKRRLHSRQWQLSNKSDDYEEAKRMARRLCPKGSDIYTEPGHGLQEAFFGSSRGKTWSAMIDTKEHK